MRREWRPRQLGLKIGKTIPVNIAFKDGLVIHGPWLVDLEVMQLTRGIAERQFRNEFERLIAGAELRIDPAKIDGVDGVLKVKDLVARRCGLAGVFLAVEIVESSPGPPLITSAPRPPTSRSLPGPPARGRAKARKDQVSVDVTVIAYLPYLPAKFQG